MTILMFHCLVLVGGKTRVGWSVIDVVNLNALNRSIEYKLSCPKPYCRRHIRIGHKLQGDGSSGASRLLHAGDSLLDCFAASLAILLRKLW